MTELGSPRGPRRDPSARDDQRSLLSDAPTVELLLKFNAGDHEALEAILQRCLPPLRRFAHGKLPPGARGRLDTEDLVQDVVAKVIPRLDRFHPQHVGAMQAYLRQMVINKVRDLV